jgi:hypothetical protein
MYFFARLGIDLQISIIGFSHELLVFSIFHRENVESESHTGMGVPLNPTQRGDGKPTQKPSLLQA